MTKSMKSLMMGAALAGFMAGNTMVAQNTSSTNSVSSSVNNGQLASSFSTEKHACKGQNSCKGNGGCKSGDNGCKGKNSCKGKGGCATDGSKSH